MKLSERAKEALYESTIPQYMHDGIILYYENGIRPGSFLNAVIDNDLRLACIKADDVNKHCLFAYMKWFYNHAPIGTWGYPGAVEKYVNEFHAEAVT